MQPLKEMNLVNPEMPQKLQLDLWQKWGSDLKLAGTYLSNPSDLAVTQNSALQVDGGASSSSESSVTWDSLQTGESTNAVISAAGRTPKGCCSKAATERLMRMTVKDLSPYFNMPIKEASKALEVGLTVLKKHCRALGIRCWPQRKLKSLDGMIDNFPGFNNEVSASVLTVEELQEQRKQITEHPGMELSDTIKRSRQAIFKWSYKKKRRYSLASVGGSSVVKDAMVYPATSAENLQRSSTYYNIT